MNGLKCKVCGSKVNDYSYKIECTKFIGDFYVIKNVTAVKRCLHTLNLQI